MRCLNQQQIEKLSRGKDDPSAARLLAHIERCEDCWRRLQQAQADARLIADIAELRERREAVRPLVEGVSSTDRPA